MTPTTPKSPVDTIREALEAAQTAMASAYDGPSSLNRSRLREWLKKRQAALEALSALSSISTQPAQTMTKDEKLAYFEARVKPSSDDPQAQTEGLEEPDHICDLLMELHGEFYGKGKAHADAFRAIPKVVDFIKSRSLPRQKGDPVAWMTEDSHGRTMLFHDINEARTYCDEDEEPTALYK